jgi:hypothetical protein
MKRLLFLSILFSLICFFSTAHAQEEEAELKIITLDQDDGLLAVPSRIVVYPGDSLQFRSVNGDFDIYIIDAISFLEIGEVDLKVRVDSSTESESQKYIVRRIDNDADINIQYAVYCISQNSWPDAPPRIIIVAQ